MGELHGVTWGEMQAFWDRWVERRCPGCEAELVGLCIRKSQVVFLNQKTKCLVKKDVLTEACIWRVVIATSPV